MQTGPVQNQESQGSDCHPPTGGPDPGLCGGEPAAGSLGELVAGSELRSPGKSAPLSVGKSVRQVRVSHSASNLNLSFLICKVK